MVQFLYHLNMIFQMWPELNTILQMCPGPNRRKQPPCFPEVHIFITAFQSYLMLSNHRTCTQVAQLNLYLTGNTKVFFKPMTIKLRAAQCLPNIPLAFSSFPSLPWLGPSLCLWWWQWHVSLLGSYETVPPPLLSSLLPWPWKTYSRER